MRGFYVLLIFVPRQERIRVGSLGVLEFSPGRYAYVGKAIGISLERRLSRHFKRNKTLRRHIDYLTSRFKPIEARYTEEARSEEEIVEEMTAIGRKPVFKGFGSSDSKAYSHLLYSEFKRGLPKKYKRKKFEPVRSICYDSRIREAL